MQKYSDKAVILHTYTQQAGRRNFMVYGAASRRKRATLPAPMTLVEVVWDDHSARELPALRDIHTLYVPAHADDVRRQCVALFLAEVLFRILRHPLPDDDLFRLVEQTAVELDHTDRPQDLHLRCLVALAECLGFAIDAEEHPELLALPASREQRQQQLVALCDYLRLHVEEMPEIASLPVLMEVFD